MAGDAAFCIGVRNRKGQIGVEDGYGDKVFDCRRTRIVYELFKDGNESRIARGSH